MKTKIKALELVGFTVWIFCCLMFTIILCQFILPEDFQANNLLKELVEVRSFFKRTTVVIFGLVLLVPLPLAFHMLVIATDPSDFTNFQGKWV